MSVAPLPRDEADRLATLHKLRVLDTPADEAMTALARLVSRVLDFPISLVSLVDAERQWFKAAVGLDVAETERDSSFCSHAILGDELFEIPDATNDAASRTTRSSPATCTSGSTPACPSRWTSIGSAPCA